MSNTGYCESLVSGSNVPLHKVLTRSVAYPDPSSPGLYQSRVSLSPGPCTLSEQSSLAAPIDPRARQAPVELVSAVTQLTRLLVPEIGYEVHLLPFRSQETLLALTVSAVGTYLELELPAVDLSAVVVFVATAVFAEVAVAAVALGSDEIDGSNRSVMT